MMLFHSAGGLVYLAVFEFGLFGSGGGHSIWQPGRWYLYHPYTSGY